MKKTLIALSLAALSGAAFADVTLYGQIKAGVEVSRVKTKVAGQEGAKTKTASELADFGSRIGFKGHESLGNGTNLIWKLEQSASVAGNSTGWATREGYIGLETQAGTIRAGKISNQLDNMGTIDTWEYSNNALGLGVFTRTSDKVLSVRYDSPVVAGFSGNVQYQLRDNVNPSDKYVHGVAPRDAYHAGLNYENAGFFAQYGVTVKKNNAFNAEGKLVDGQAHRLEAGYDANNLFVGLGAQYTKGFDSVDSWTKHDASTGAAAEEVKAVEAAVTAAYAFGNVKPKVSYAHGFDRKVNGVKEKGSKYDQVVLGADYGFSKRTTAFAQAGWLRVGSNDTHTTTTAGLVGLRHKF